MENVGLMVALAGAMTKAPSTAQVTSAVDAWLTDHPEATTTVEDGSITNAKLASSFVTPGTASAYSSSATYAVGDYCVHNGSLYRCTTAITTAEAWTAAHWAAAVLGDDVGDLKSAIKDTTDYVKNESNIFAQTVIVSGSLNDRYINNSGVIGSDSSFSGYYAACEPNTVYVIKRPSANNKYFAIGITNVVSASSIATGLQMDGFEKSNTATELYIFTKSDSTYIFYYGDDGQIGDISALKVVKSDAIYKGLSNSFWKTPALIGGSFNNVYFTNKGIIASDNSFSGNWLSCKPNTVYTVRRNSADGKWLAIGCTNVSSTDFVVGAQMTGFVKSKTDKELSILTGNDSTYVLYYGDDVQFSGIAIEEQIPAYEIYAVNALVERGGLTSEGKTSSARADHTGNIRTAYTIKTNGATAVRVFAPGLTCSGWGLYGYNSSLAFVDRITGSDTSFPESGLVIRIKPTYSYIRFVVSSPANYTNTMQMVFTGGSLAPEQVKNAKMRTDTEYYTFDVEGEMFTFADAMLPSNYTIDGKKVPLILWLDGSGALTAWANDFGTKKPYIKYLMDEGFAVLTVFGWGSYFYDKYPNCGQAYPYPTPTGLKCLKAGVDWFCDRYNVDRDNIHIMSKSQGGANALYYASRQDFPVKSIGMFSPVVDYITQTGQTIYADSRAAVAEDIGFVGDDVSWFASTDFVVRNNEARVLAFWQENITQLAQINEKWTGVVNGTLAEKLSSSWTNARAFWDGRYWEDTTKTDIYTDDDYVKVASIPVKVWAAKDDDNVPYLAMLEVVKQIQNSGCEATIETLPDDTGGHNCADLPEGGNVIPSVTTALGVMYADLPIGWYENVLWIRQHMAKS